jgi:hypothetical protein
LSGGNSRGVREQLRHANNATQERVFY